ncbi:MAG: hypothetical protein V3U90_08155 [Dehalococcoidia bacterium]
MVPDEFKRQLDELSTVILDGIIYFTVWDGLMVESDEAAQALNRYRGLFLPARNALLWMALLQLAKVFDRDPRTVSFRNLISAAKENREDLTPHATEEDLNQIQQQVDDNEALLERLKRLRDQRIAHHDSTTSGDRTVLFGELQRLVEEIKSMYNSLRRGHDRACIAFDVPIGDAERHTSEVVRIMCEDRD